MPDKDNAEALASLERLNSDTIDWSETRNSWRRSDLRSRWHKQTNEWRRPVTQQ